MVGKSVTDSAAALIYTAARRLLELLQLPLKGQPEEAPAAALSKLNIFKLQVTTVNNLSNRVPESFSSGAQGGNLLWQYIQSMSPETVTQLSKPSSDEVLQVMERTIVEMLGHLPSSQFDVNITTSRDNLGRLLVSAMINGYFLHNVEQRVALDKSL